jgi:hypothetical protein
MATLPAIEPPASGPLQDDTHEAQRQRVAAHCDAHPGQFFSAPEFGVACDLGSASKVLSSMSKTPGYAIQKTRQRVICVGGKLQRRRVFYRVTACPIQSQTEFFPKS